MADAIRTVPREDRVLFGPATTFAIAEEIIQFVSTSTAAPAELSNHHYDWAWQLAGTGRK